ncbi:MAG: hypothetical protein IT430_18300 [Phycisphaerales bacterium]|nr:hypothetical protein [Phycisphaerales bacterium]
MSEAWRDMSSPARRAGAFVPSGKRGEAEGGRNRAVERIVTPWRIESGAHMTWPPTRPVRKRLFGAAFLLVWLAGMYIVWGRASEFVFDGTSFGLVSGSDVTTYGWSGWLVRSIQYEETAPGNTVYGESSFEVQSYGLMKALAASGVLAVGFFVSWRVLIGRAVPSERTCDHCDYDLRGLTSSRCPECGTETAAS